MTTRRTTWPTPPADRAAFLNAIIDNPADDTPRLVYADWLDEHGDPDRAEFIRVQCRLAALPPGDPDYPALVVRAGRLFRAHGLGWTSALGVRASPVDFDRGFLRAVTLTPAWFGRVAEPLFAAEPVRVVRFRRQSPRRRTEPLSRHWLRPALAAPALRQVAGLNLAWTGLIAEHLRSLARSPHLGALHTLDLSHTPHMTAAGVRAVADAPAFGSLRRLVARACGRGERLQRPGLGPDLTEILAGSAVLSGLEDLDLARNALGDAGAAAVARAGWRLRSLDLVANQIAEPGAAALAGSDNFGGLGRLILRHNRVGDGGAVALARSASFGEMRVLDLRRNRIGNTGATALAGSAWVGGLETLRLGGNPGIAYETAFRLFQRLGDRLDMAGDPD